MLAYLLSGSFVRLGVRRVLLSPVYYEQLGTKLGTKNRTELGEFRNHQRFRTRVRESGDERPLLPPERATMNRCEHECFKSWWDRASNLGGGAVGRAATRGMCATSNDLTG